MLIIDGPVQYTKITWESWRLKSPETHLFVQPVTPTPNPTTTRPLTPFATHPQSCIESFTRQLALRPNER